ncbi:PH domain-containing protein [Paenibacillus sp. N1-5-1-14]|uniref:PH domain-containing protein n=1 Tax=Paenibacillus radicibacter TaxID=2972488 RepID=UPI0021598F3C|nr:PH domain-containing protein [Paenibacillus radicibacter]MCR8644325.1 PH domain-containing protein [Paenibacillus radicibacter]
MNEDQLQHVDIKIMNARILEGWITILVEAIIVSALFIVSLKFEWPIWYAVGAAVLVFIAIPFEINVVPKWKYKSWKYAIHEHEVELWHGLIFKKRTLIPMVRIQHVDSKQGPILRKYGLYTINFSTAAGSHEIPGLAEEAAEDVRRRIAELARIGDNDV